jgi:hypothetical protein
VVKIGLKWSDKRFLSHSVVLVVNQLRNGVNKPLLCLLRIGDDHIAISVNLPLYKWGINMYWRSSYVACMHCCARNFPESVCWYFYMPENQIISIEASFFQLNEKTIPLNAKNISLNEKTVSFNEKYFPLNEKSNPVNTKYFS